MPRHFSYATAELMIQVVEAVHVIRDAEVAFIENFCDLSRTQAQNALDLAVDIGLLEKNANCYKTCNPLVRFLNVPDERRKASLLRIILESYEPFTKFRERLSATDSADTAAQQVKTVFNLDAHREEIKHTLISLGTYTNAINSEGGGKYKVTFEEIPNQLFEVAATCNDLAAAEASVRNEIGAYADALNLNEVIRPLASALLKARGNEAAQAVNEAANAVESYLVRLAQRLGVNMAGANGINQKLDKFRTNNQLPKKIVEAAKYLGQVRNAADHGVDIDPDVGSVWVIHNNTALQYIFVACSFIRSCGARENNDDFII